MNTKLLQLGRRLWSSPDVPRELNRHNLRAWARSVHRLGNRWLLAIYQPRKAD
jgi:hypothetical protein